ncbi:MAG: hypothetical protein JJE55_08085 [Flavobacteriaceae bacterium]|nr:hypothetical protein [Flavobacteriaceae bacterium]
MATHIRCLFSDKENVILVNGKSVHKDMDGAWKAREELTVPEAKAFDAFRETVENHSKLGVEFAEYALKS